MVGAARGGAGDPRRARRQLPDRGGRAQPGAAPLPPWRTDGEDLGRGTLRAPGWWSDANLARLHRSLAKISSVLDADRFTAADWQALMDSYFAAAPRPEPLSAARSR